MSMVGGTLESGEPNATSLSVATVSGQEREDEEWRRGRKSIVAVRTVVTSQQCNVYTPHRIRMWYACTTSHHQYRPEAVLASSPG